ncbi:hypothetical protein AAE478_009761 [Parahypoxylon ruwenzoriense]
MKNITAILATCLWYTAGAILTRRPEIPSPRERFPHLIEPVSYARKNSDSALTVLNNGSVLGNLTTYCKSSSFVNATIARSAPPAGDCAALASSAVPALGAGYWRYDGADLAARRLPAGNAGSARIGSQDVVNVVAEAVRRFAKGGGRGAKNGTVMGAAGAMWCDDPGTMVNWALYRV